MQYMPEPLASDLVALSKTKCSTRSLHIALDLLQSWKGSTSKLVEEIRLHDSWDEKRETLEWWQSSRCVTCDYARQSATVTHNKRIWHPKPCAAHITLKPNTH